MDSIERDVFIEARPEQVWTALTRPERFATWYAFGGAAIELRPAALKRRVDTLCARMMMRHR
jgi:uncharacterized protein YndB with AHSA1/START domain